MLLWSPSWNQKQLEGLFWAVFNNSIDISSSKRFKPFQYLTKTLKLITISLLFWRSSLAVSWFMLSRSFISFGGCKMTPFLCISHLYLWEASTVSQALFIVCSEAKTLTPDTGRVVYVLLRYDINAKPSGKHNIGHTDPFIFIWRAHGDPCIIKEKLIKVGQGTDHRKNFLSWMQVLRHFTNYLISVRQRETQLSENTHAQNNRYHPAKHKKIPITCHCVFR